VSCQKEQDHSGFYFAEPTLPAMESFSNTDDDTQESVGIVNEIIDCCTEDCDGVSPDGQCGHCVLEEHPYPLKRNHSIITLQTTTILRIPPISQPSSRVHSFPATDAEEDTENASSKDNCQCSPAPRGLLESVGAIKEAEVAMFDMCIWCNRER
jgi:hypothetical protein